VDDAVSQGPAPRADVAQPSASTKLQAAYDALPYGRLPFAQSHPDRLATLASLFGASPPPVERCRVLEVGCASGGNLIPMAASLPYAQFVGIDFSPVQIAQGTADISALGLGNIELVQADIRSFDAGGARFDYFIAHGVLSWVPHDVQERMFEMCSEWLAPQGVAYISYNTLPGWRMRGAVRDAMLHQSRRFKDPAARVQQARAVLDFLAESLQSADSGYARMLRDEALRVRREPDFYIYHEYLEEVNDAMYFHEFIERAGAHGLRYLAESEFYAMLLHDLAPNVATMLSRIAPGLMQREQLLDFLRNQTFRQTLLVRDGTSLTRKVSPECLFGLHIASRAVPVHPEPDLSSPAVEEFRMPSGSSLQSQRPLTKAAMMALIHESPLAIAFDALCGMAAARLGMTAVPAAERSVMASDLLQAYTAGIVELRAMASPFVVDPGETPRASAVARLQAARGMHVTNLRHEWTPLEEPARRLLALLDGKRSRADIAALALPDADPVAARAMLDAALTWLARQALLVRPS
jgi:cyclopropane fatty-acyl-phospholipid synthase-like methyltransferase